MTVGEVSCRSNTVGEVSVNPYTNGFSSSHCRLLVTASAPSCPVCGNSSVAEAEEPKLPENVPAPKPLSHATSHSSIGELVRYFSNFFFFFFNALLVLVV